MVFTTMVSKIAESDVLPLVHIASAMIAPLYLCLCTIPLMNEVDELIGQSFSSSDPHGDVQQTTGLSNNRRFSTDQPKSNVLLKKSGDAMGPAAIQGESQSMNQSQSMEKDASVNVDGNEEDAAELPRLAKLGVPTLGGMQFWGDVHFLQGWKIQRNVFSGHYRLLNPSALRFASGTFEHCLAVLKAAAQERQLVADTGKAVILLHGIGRSSKSLQKMGDALRKDGYVVIPFEYPSTRVTLEQAAEYLDSVIKSVPQVTSIDFVVHSMGGLVVRTYLKQHAQDARIAHLVMLGTPNYGAEMADMLKATVLFRLAYGPAGKQLVTHEQGAIQSLPIPNFAFGIVAGGRGNGSGFNPLLPDDNDGTVTVTSARLSGAADFLFVNKIHSLLMSDDTVIRATRHFLEHQRFRAEEPAQPIP